MNSLTVKRFIVAAMETLCGWLDWIPTWVVAARLGHADAAITLRVYAHVLREDTADVGNVFAAAVRSG